MDKNKMSSWNIKFPTQSDVMLINYFDKAVD